MSGPDTANKMKVETWCVSLKPYCFIEVLHWRWHFVPKQTKERDHVQVSCTWSWAAYPLSQSKRLNFQLLTSLSTFQPWSAKHLICPMQWQGDINATQRIVHGVPILNSEKMFPEEPVLDSVLHVFVLLSYSYYWMALLAMTEVTKKPHLFGIQVRKLTFEMKECFSKRPPVKCVIWNKKSTVMRVKATVSASKCCFAGAMKIMEQLMVPPDQPSLTVSPSLPAGRSDEGSASSLPEVQSCWDESNIKRFDAK